MLPTSVPTRVVASVVPTATPAPAITASPTPSPTASPVREVAYFRFADFDPDYAAVYTVNGHHFGPIRPNERTGFYPIESGAHATFSLHLPDRPACDQTDHASSPLTGHWVIYASRRADDPGCALLNIQGDDPIGVGMPSNTDATSPRPPTSPTPTPGSTSSPTASATASATP